MRAAVYTRISRDDAGDGLGVQRQDDDCRALAARRGWQVAQTYVDNDTSAYNGRRRPAYEALVQAVEGGQVQVVLAWAPERLHRSPRELEDFLELIERRGVIVETIKAGAWDVSTSHGRLVARMLGAVSRAESERTGERVSRAHQQAKAQGKWRGPIPFGLRAGLHAGEPEVEPTESETVEWIFGQVLRGEALTRIAAELNRSGSRPRRGQAWTHTGIQRLVCSPALGGLVQVDGELRPAAFTGVVSPGTWHAAQSELRNRPRGETRRPREKLTLLGGILQCAEHGDVCFGGSASHAPTYVANKPGLCHVSITRDAADSFVSAVVIARLERPDAAALFMTGPSDDRTRERQELQDRRDAIAGLLADGLLTATAARTQLTAIGDRLSQLQPSPAGRAVHAVKLTSKPTETWEALTQPQRRAVLGILFDKITLDHVGPKGGPRADPRRISFEWATAD